jgi:phosphoesterase RecJ-like protein
MFRQLEEEINKASNILILQAENPDGDSLASMLALEGLIYDNFTNKNLILYSITGVSSYLKYLEGWDRVVNILPTKTDLVILVDCADESLLASTFMQDQFSIIKNARVISIDHHNVVKNENRAIKDLVDITDTEACSTGELLLHLVLQIGWKISKDSAEKMLASVLSDTRGLTNPGVKARHIKSVATLIDLGASISEIDDKRRSVLKRSVALTRYKGELLLKTEFLCDGILALTVIKEEEIKEYSGEHNPPALIIDDLRMTEGVKIVIFIKDYQSRNIITAKLRSSSDFLYAGEIAEYFGGGGHAGASGIKVKNYKGGLDQFKKDLINKVWSYLN